MIKNVCTDRELAEAIKQCWDSSSERSGILVQRCDVVWHYGVTLSDTKAISWGPCTAPSLYDEGCLSVHDLSDEFKDTIHVLYLSKHEIFKNIIASVFAFHTKWKYGVQGWNCEHWARLVVSGEPISYQVKEQGFGLFDVFGALHVRYEAIERLNNYKLELCD